ncbi:hypothetical protein [Desulfotruncus alcoholivorax]|uniref:hypothetical protein n=1 Tax=Desulfotruncus alcoholivorax TaxID=265477 RepID=UPI0004165380|nr:hypothetical protein [Desulfotruncus alcoholivorax]
MFKNTKVILCIMVFLTVFNLNAVSSLGAAYLPSSDTGCNVDFSFYYDASVDGSTKYSSVIFTVPSGRLFNKAVFTTRFYTVYGTHVYVYLRGQDINENWFVFGPYDSSSSNQTYTLAISPLLKNITFSVYFGYASSSSAKGTVEIYLTSYGSSFSIPDSNEFLQVSNTVSNAYNAANAAKSSADAANSNAWNAYNSIVNGVGNNGKSLSATYDRAADAMNNAWYNGVAYGGKSESVGNIAGYIRNTQLPSLDTKITNIQNMLASNDNTPPDIKKVSGTNGATCTTGSTYTVVISASDNGPASNLRYRVTCDSFDSGWVSSNSINITGLTGAGAKTATIMVSDNPTAPDSGNVAQTSYTFFKI